MTRAKPGFSTHNYGLATDWTIFVNGVPSWPPRQDPRWKEYGEACQKVGLTWGADWDGDGDIEEHSFIDCPHNELTPALPYAKLKEAYEKGGINAVEALLCGKS